MKELEELDQKISYLESLGESVKSKKQEVSKVIFRQNELAKMKLEQADRLKIKLLRERIAELRKKFSPGYTSTPPIDKKEKSNAVDVSKPSIKEDDLYKLAQKIDMLEKLELDVKNHKAEVIEATELHNHILKMNLNPEQREQLRTLRTRLGSIRDQYFPKISTSTPKTIVFQPSVNKNHEKIIEPIMKSDEENFLKALKKLFEESPNININFVDSLYNTLLCVAVANQMRKSTEFLLDHGANPNFPGVDQTYPLLYAAMSGDEGIFDLLVRSGAEINAQDKHGNTPMIIAIDKRNFKLAMHILDHYPVQIDKSDNEGFTALFSAIYAKSVPLVQKLLELGANPDHKTKHGLTPFNICTTEARKESGHTKNSIFTSELSAEIRLIYKMIMESSKQTVNIVEPTGLVTEVKSIGMINPGRRK